MRLRTFCGHVVHPGAAGATAPVPADLLERSSAARLRALVREGRFVAEGPSFLVHRVTEAGRPLTGVVAEVPLDAYLDGELKPHESVRDELVERLAAHRETVRAELVPVLAAYRSAPPLDAVLAEVTGGHPLVEVTVGAVRHSLWRVPSRHEDRLRRELAALRELYIVDGHHRVEAARRVLGRGGSTGPDPADSRARLLSVLVPAGELRIAPYHRWVRDVADLTDGELLARVRRNFVVDAVRPVAPRAAPGRRGEFAMRLDGTWYRLRARADARTRGGAPVPDVTLLQEAILGPVLGVGDPDEDSRLEFVAGPEGLDALARRCRESGGVAFALHPAAVDEVLASADAGQVLPPKSTWFGPKLAPGLLVRLLDGAD
ncbi:MAG: DUF1015 family protein [Nitriliruptorales bacterium]